ncbi:hypothetical protein K466DRAFT_368981 [Polyporus arcularius HHB13444]|uniref:Uncharacterized protein n=1 Tax=Polyporus arcularius HHB13444 TaxID=1314778 RepID=A0A5C3PN09_9APHY|nr:hypothetical protein K466DRAFT_368981 [Polyporus arcularius HHB13444]
MTVPHISHLCRPLVHRSTALELSLSLSHSLILARTRTRSLVRRRFASASRAVVPRRRGGRSVAPCVCRRACVDCFKESGGLGCVLLLHMRDVGELVTDVARPCWLLMRGVLGSPMSLRRLWMEVSVGCFCGFVAFVAACVVLLRYC